MSRRSALAAVATAVVTVALAPASEAKSGTLPPRTFGVAVPGAPGDLTELNQISTLTGRSPDSVTWYAAWSSGEDFPSSAVASIRATGATPEVTWEPWDPTAGTVQPACALKRVAAGDFDSYISRWATQIKSYGKPVIIRLAHEMNGTWYPWSEQVNGNAPGDYVAAWRHVVGVFRADRVSNVSWRWSPNVPYAGSTSLSQLYPGDAYVDQVALDGYNWSNLQPGSTWTSFADVFSGGIGVVRAITSKPLYIGEVGCPETGGDKAAWVDDMFSWLGAHPEVRGFTWFNYNKETDWRIESSDASLAAFQRGLPSFH